MINIHSFLIQVGFDLKIHSKSDYNGFYLKEQEIQINIVSCDSIISIQAQNEKGLQRTLIDNSKINTIEDLVFMLSRNIFFSRNFKYLLQEMIQLQTLSDVKLP